MSISDPKNQCAEATECQLKMPLQLSPCHRLFPLFPAFSSRVQRVYLSKHFCSAAIIDCQPCVYNKFFSQNVYTP